MKISSFNAFLLSTMLSCLLLSSNCILSSRNPKFLPKPDSVIIEEITIDTSFTINNHTNHTHEHKTIIHKLNFNRTNDDQDIQVPKAHFMVKNSPEIHNKIKNLKHRDSFVERFKNGTIKLIKTGNVMEILRNETESHKFLAVKYNLIK